MHTQEPSIISRESWPRNRAKERGFVGRHRLKTSEELSNRRGMPTLIGQSITPEPRDGLMLLRRTSFSMGPSSMFSQTLILYMPVLLGELSNSSLPYVIVQR